MKRYTVALLFVLVLTGFAGAATAKDICLDGGTSGQLVFRKVKKLKAGGAISLAGMYLISGTESACEGAATMNSAGTSISVGIFCHALLVSNNFTWEWTATDATLAGSGDRDINGDYNPDLSPLTLTSIDCSTVTIP